MPPKTVYTKLQPREAVLNAPEMYAGSLDRENRKEYHYVEIADTSRIVLQETDVPFAMIHIFKECTSNVADNCVASREIHVNPGKCIIRVRGSQVSIWSFGKPISIEYTEEYQQMVPYYIFSDLHSGANFEEQDNGKKVKKNRTGGGRHGLGVKLGNILSTKFSVDIRNADQGRSYSMTWKDNRSVDGTERINYKYAGTESSVRVTYNLDMQRFGYAYQEEYSESAIQIFKWVASCLSFTAEIPVTFNGQTFDYTDPKKYASLYTDTPKLGKYVIYTDHYNKFIAIDSPGTGKQISFANSIITHAGGTHVNCALKAITSGLTVGKGKDLQIPDLRDIKRNVILIISVQVQDPKWGNGQTKTKLDKPTNIKFELPVDVLDKIKKWSLLKMLEASLKLKSVEDIFKESKGKIKHLGKVKGKDANWAGHVSKWKQCTLAALEGGSAAQYELELLNHDPNGRNTRGVLELRGKPVNVMKATARGFVSGIDIALRNVEIREIVQRLNVKPNMDYSIQKNFETLRYGKFLIMTDPDPDGYHIGALLLALFHMFFPTLLHRNNFVYSWFRPIIQVTRGTKMHRFYSRKEYTQWTLKTPNYKSWTPRYFKGLGSCTPEDIARDYVDHREVLMHYNSEAADKISMAFGKTNNRREWINNWNPEEQGDIPADEMEIARFVDWYVREYAYETLLRNLPAFDGLTRAKRKVIYTAFKVWGRESGGTTKMKIQPNFAGRVGEKTKYHQGDSIPGVVIGLAQTYRGTNNLPLLRGFGAFGSINGGMKDASQPRYLEVTARKILALIFRPEDDKCLNFIEDEGESIEPKFYVPIIPMALVNGISAVGMGSSSTFANYHPLEVIDSYINYLVSREPFQELEPWYRDNSGLTELVDKTFTSYGVVEKVTLNGCTITQLPIGVWHKTFEKKLDAWILEGKLKDYDCHCTATKTRYVLRGISDFTDDLGNIRATTLDDLNLITRLNLANMTIVNEHGLVVTYKTLVEFISAFYDFRIPYYVARKKIILEDIEANIQIYEHKRNYLEALASGKLVTVPVGTERLDEELVLQRIQNLGLVTGFYKDTSRLPETLGTVKIKPITDNDRSLQGCNRLEVNLVKYQEQYRSILEITPESMWLSDLQELRNAYVKEYGEDQRITIV